MNTSLKASIVTKSFGNNMKPRYIVDLDQDAAEIMGETKLRYAFESETCAVKFAEVLQSNFDALHDEALAD